MSFPKYMIGTGSLAVFKMFSPELGYALTTGCGMPSGTIITSLNGLADVPVEYGAQFDDNEYTAERVDAERQLGVARLPIDGPVTGVPVKDIIGGYKFSDDTVIPVPQKQKTEDRLYA